MVVEFRPFLVLRNWFYVFCYVVIPAFCFGNETTTFTVTVENTWSVETHGSVPPTAHFSWFGGGTHNDSISFWEVGQLASPGLIRMAETGVTTTLLDEISLEIAAGNAFNLIDERHWFCPPATNAPNCGDLEFSIEVNSGFSQVTMVSMLGPTPDWFVGLSGLNLRSEGQWINELVVELVPFDGGTRSANVFALFGPLTIPQDPITLITKESGQIITPLVLGNITFTRNVILGDVNCDGAVDLLDVLPFVAFVASGEFQDEADINLDGLVDLLDIAGFVELLVD